MNTKYPQQQQQQQGRQAHNKEHKRLNKKKMSLFKGERKRHNKKQR